MFPVKPSQTIISTSSFKIYRGSIFPINDHRNYNINGDAFDVGETFSGVNYTKGLEAVEKLKELVPVNFTLADIALKWILMHKAVTVVIPGAVCPN